MEVVVTWWVQHGMCTSKWSPIEMKLAITTFCSMKWLSIFLCIRDHLAELQNTALNLWFPFEMVKTWKILLALNLLDVRFNIDFGFLAMVTSFRSFKLSQNLMLKYRKKCWIRSKILDSLMAWLAQAWFLAFGKKLKGKKLKTQGKNSKLKQKTHEFGI